jgi:hypothetical protein
MSGQVQRSSPDLDLALIGDCRVTALIDRYPHIVWLCFPRFDVPVLSRLLAGDEETGSCEASLVDLADSNAKYPGNTAVVEKILTYAHGAQVRARDFAPRLDRFERTFRSITGITNTAIRLSSSWEGAWARV